MVFEKQDGACVIYDNSRGNEINIYATHVGLDGHVSKGFLGA